MQHPLAFEGRDFVHRPVRWSAPRIEKRCAEANPDRMTIMGEGWPELVGKAQRAGGERVQKRAAMRDRVAAVRPAADRDGRAPGFAIEDFASRSRAGDCAEDGQLRKVDADRSTEAARPRATGADDH